MQPRPAAITVFGILNIVFAAFGIFGLLGSAVMLFGTPDSNNPVIKIMHENPGYATWLKVNLLLGIPSCACLAASGIGLLRLKSWARILSIVYAVYAILLGFLGVAINVIFLVLPLLRRAQEQNGPEAVGFIAGAIGGSLGGCIGLVYPVLLLMFLTRPKLAAAFRENPQSATLPPQ
jgi:hypothetical protein